MKFKKKLYILTLFFFASYVFAIPGFDNNDAIYSYNEDLYSECGILIKQSNFSPMPYAYIMNSIESLDKTSISSKCSKVLDEIKAYVRSKFLDRILKVGMQGKVDNLYLQERGYRYQDNDNLFINLYRSNKSFTINIKLTKSNDQERFDSSYISYYLNEKFVFTYGKTTKWWSPSNDTSLILSNSARPFESFSIQNYKPIEPKINLFQNIIGKYSYDVFVGRLEKNRQVPNTLIFGNRFTIHPYKNLDISFLRVAQFGGDGRTVNASTFKNMILGQDTTNRNLSFSDQPGNQIAGIDFSYEVANKSRLRIYGQYLGEDGLDPIIDDRYIGAIFPSKRFGMAGIDFYKTIGSKKWLINIEHSNTDTGFKNITYNHSIYKSGYRFYGEPIGASIDSDSHKSFLSIQSNKNNNLFKIKFQKVSLNQNQYELNKWKGNALSFDEIRFKYKKLFKNLDFEINFITRSNGFNNLVFFKLEHSL